MTRTCSAAWYKVSICFEIETLWRYVPADACQHYFVFNGIRHRLMPIQFNSLYDDHIIQHLRLGVVLDY